MGGDLLCPFSPQHTCEAMPWPISGLTPQRDLGLKLQAVGRKPQPLPSSPSSAFQARYPKGSALEPRKPPSAPGLHSVALVLEGGGDRGLSQGQVSLCPLGA